ncbi:MAG TPA: methyl-accepting chemotaxis protein [Spirochaetaceae bacterium]|nr:methyl-accepting chemotaxis protein [Spirochaetaceae bacterium]
MKLKDLSIGQKLTAIIAFLVIASCAGLSALAYTATTASLERSITTSLKTMANEASRLVRARMDYYVASIEGVANNPVMRSMDWERQQALLGTELTRLGYLGMGIVSMDGTARYHDNSTAQLGDRGYIQSAIDGATNFSDVLISRVTNQAVIMLATPVYTAPNTKGAILIARLDGGLLSNITERIRYGNVSHTFIINGKGALVAHGNRDYVLQIKNFVEESATKPEYLGLAAMMKRMMAGENSFGSYSLEGQEMLYGFAPIQGTDWSVAVGASRDEVFADVLRLRNQMLLFLAVAVIIALGLTFLFARGLSKPIVRVKTLLKDISDGEGDLTKRLPVNSADEIGRLSHYVNQTFEKMRNLIVAIQAQAASLQTIGSDMASSMSQTAAAVNQISANINGVKNQIINQAAGVEESNATIESIAGSIEKLDEHVASQSASIIESSAAIAQMIANVESVGAILNRNNANVQELIKASEIGQNGINTVSENIKTIANESAGLLEASSVIAGIANQTNLLAMNAAIEAAHAGDAGRGFAVVADEIRKLAENSGMQAKNITQVLNSLKGSIDLVTKSSSEALDQFDTIVSMVGTVSQQESIIQNAMQEQNSGSKQILEALTDITSITNAVKERTNEMLSGSKDVLYEMRQLAQVTQEISVNMNEMAEGTQEINNAVQHVDQISERNKESIDRLIVEISRFKV